MRPTRLELQGFASFLDATVVDFDDADLFVLSGPTGAGKSSVIDAMVFALYGVVPRYDDRRLVAPVITQGAVEARVRLFFEVGGAAYSATRVVRRRGEGATTKEARLERLKDGRAPIVMASGADELTASVERLLGLPFEHFVKTVVLPQGAFQAFMHAKASERQDLLVELLGLDVYRRTGRLAREREKTADRQVEMIQRQLEGELALATPDARARAAARVEALGALRDKLADAQPDLDELRTRGERLAKHLSDTRRRAALLDGVQPPSGLGALSDDHDAAVRALRAAETALTAAAERLDAAERRSDALPAAAVVDTLRTILDERTALATRVTRARTTLEAATAAAERAARAVTERQEHLDAARAAQETALRADLARTLAAGVAVGDDCPVCARPVEAPLDGHDDDGLRQAKEAVRRAEQARETADAARRTADSALASAAADARNLDERARDLELRRAELADSLGLAADDPDARLAGRLTELATDVAAASERLREARDREREARRGVAAARDRLGQIDDRRAAAVRALDAARDRLGTLDPPALDREDLAGAWRTLEGFVNEQRPRLAEQADALDRRIATARRDYRARLEELRALCREHGVEPGDRAPSDACAEALGAATVRLERLDADLERAATLRDEERTARRRGQVARALGQELSARNFERWLLDRALRRLVVGASMILRDLSGGGYSLTIDDASAFVVVDHRSADQRRSARTLSGGETFLASLSLALALGDQVRDLAADGTARLEALFLDEGFGTLDAETLDVVADAIEELGARGRMVGLITHVRDLAERVPVRFEVSRVAGASRIERVPA